MPTYSVFWTSEAEDDLALIWQRAADRSAVVKSAELADRYLGSNPHHYGNPLSEGLWAILVPPLQVYFQIDEEARRIDVTHVRRIA
jgi:hypothetical protein